MPWVSDDFISDFYSRHTFYSYRASDSSAESAVWNGWIVDLRDGIARRLHCAGRGHVTWNLHHFGRSGLLIRGGVGHER